MTMTIHYNQTPEFFDAFTGLDIDAMKRDFVAAFTAAAEATYPGCEVVVTYNLSGPTVRCEPENDALRDEILHMAESAWDRALGANDPVSVPTKEQLYRELCIEAGTYTGGEMSAEAWYAACSHNITASMDETFAAAASGDAAAIAEARQLCGLPVFA